MKLAVWKQLGIDGVVCLLFCVAVLVLGNGLGDRLPTELPQMDSVALDALLPKGMGEGLDLESMKNQKGIAQMLVTFELATLEGSGARPFDPVTDMELFFSIMSALPKQEMVTMFRFQGEQLEMEYSGVDAEQFCNNLAKSGKFSTVDFVQQENGWQITCTPMK